MFYFTCMFCLISAAIKVCSFCFMFFFLLCFAVDQTHVKMYYVLSNGLVFVLVI